MIVGATMQRIPSASTLGAWSRSASSMTRVLTHGAYSRATPATDGSVPNSSISLSAGPFNAAPAMIGDTAMTSSRRAREGGQHPRDGKERSDRDDRVGRADHDPIRLVQCLENLGGGSCRLGTGEADGADGHVVVQPDEVVLEGDLCAGRPEIGGAPSV